MARSKPARAGNAAFYLGGDPSVCIHNEDFLANKARGWLPEGSVDLVVTSPPYNIDMQYGTYKDDVPYVAYLEFSREWLDGVFHVLKDDGRMCLNVPLDKNKGGQQSVAAPSQLDRFRFRR